MYRKQPAILPPWGGWNNSAPALTLPSNSFRQITNWLVSKQRLIAFPKTVATTSLTHASALWGARSFQDANANYHTLLLGDDRAYYLKSDGTLQQLGPSTWNQSKVPYAVEVFQNKVFFCNGSVDPLRFVDGSINYSLAGDAPGSSFFLGKLASRVMMINTVELGFQYVARVRWCGVNAPLEWDSTIDYTAGATDIPDVEDELSGWATINNVGFAFRKHGITTMTPTGVGAAPFYIENFSEGPSGVGVFIPYSLDTYGQLAGFIAEDDIYSFTGSSLQPIGGSAKKSILADINSASSFVRGKMLGTLGKGIDYLSYWLACPQAGDTITSLWIYHFDEQQWVNIQLPGVLRTLANVVVA